MARIAPRTLSCGAAGTDGAGWGGWGAAGRCAATARGAVITKHSKAKRRINPPSQRLPGESIVVVMRGVVLLLYVLAAGCHPVGGTSTSTGACRHSRTRVAAGDRKSTRLNSSHLVISYA